MDLCHSAWRTFCLACPKYLNDRFILIFYRINIIISVIQRETPHFGICAKVKLNLTFFFLLDLVCCFVPRGCYRTSCTKNDLACRTAKSRLMGLLRPNGSLIVFVRISSILTSVCGSQLESNISRF